MTPFVVVAVVLIVVGIGFAGAGSIGKGDYDWRAPLGIGFVLGGITTYGLGRWLRRRALGGARRGLASEQLGPRARTIGLGLRLARACLTIAATISLLAFLAALAVWAWPNPLRLGGSPAIWIRADTIDFLPDLMLSRGPWSRPVLSIPLPLVLIATLFLPMWQVDAWHRRQAREEAQEDVSP